MSTTASDSTGDPKHLSPLSIPRMFGDVPPFMGVQSAPDLAGVTADAVVVGMPYDGIATFRGGPTRRAPREIRKDSLLFGGYHLDWDLDAWDHIRVVDTGDIDVVPGDAAASYERLERRIDAITRIGAVPLTIGGDRGISYPAVRAVARARDGPMGVILFDTHPDLSESFREDRLTRVSPVRRICELPEIAPRGSRSSARAVRATWRSGPRGRGSSASGSTRWRRWRRAGSRP